MKITVQQRELSGGGRKASDWIAVPLLKAAPENRRLSGDVSALDKRLGGALRNALASGDFQGRAGETLPLYPKAGGKLQRVLLIGLGSADAVDTHALRLAAGRAVRHAMSKGSSSLALALPKHRAPTPEAAVQALAEGAVLGGYRFDEYRETPRKASLRSISLVCGAAAGLASLRAAAKVGVTLAECQNVARDLSNEPANVLPPAALARRAQKVAREVGLKCRVMGVPELERRGMGGILAVGGGSSRPPRLIVMEHNAPARGSKRRRPTLCFVGKGVTFDSGGISIKPSANMEDMKHDMSGAAAVVGAMRAVALLRIPFHVVGVIGAAENLPSGTAYRPGDVVRTLSGKTIEILNTDAEGRVVLADALYYASTEFRPQAMIDLATLTGATQVALGPWASGLFGTSQALIDSLRRAGEISGELLWPLPLLEGHHKAMKSHIADLKNTGGRFGGGSTAAAFLTAFIGNTPWAHLDIAGTGYTSTLGPCQQKGATGIGVRVLLEWLRNWTPEDV